MCEPSSHDAGGSGRCPCRCDAIRVRTCQARFRPGARIAGDRWRYRVGFSSQAKQLVHGQREHAEHRCTARRPQNAVRRSAAFVAKAGVRHHHHGRALTVAAAGQRLDGGVCALWNSVRAIPSEATFSRAFSEFADSALPSRLHEALLEASPCRIIWSGTLAAIRRRSKAARNRRRSQSRRPREAQARPAAQVEQRRYAACSRSMIGCPLALRLVPTSPATWAGRQASAPGSSATHGSARLLLDVARPCAAGRAVALRRGRRHGFGAGFSRRSPSNRARRARPDDPDGGLEQRLEQAAQRGAMSANSLNAREKVASPGSPAHCASRTVRRSVQSLASRSTSRPRGGRCRTPPWR